MNQMHTVRTGQSCVLLSRGEQAGTGTSQNVRKNQDHVGSFVSLTHIFTRYLWDFAHVPGF